MTVRVVTPPAFYPVTRAQARLWCRIDAALTAEDAVVDQLIAAMTDFAENLTGRAYIQRGLQMIVPWWPVIRVEGVMRDGFELPQAPLVSVESITYLDSDGVQQTLAAETYAVHTWREPGIVVRAYGETWPVVRSDADAIRVNYTAGYVYGSPNGEADQQAVLPPALKVWIEARLTTLYDNRSQLMRDGRVAIPRDLCDGLLDSLVLGGRII